MKKILILLFTLAMCQGNLFGQTDNNTSNRFLKAQYFGKVGGNTGSIIFTGTTSGNVTLKSADIAGTWSLTLPSTAGTANYPLLTNGSGVTSWGVLPIAGGGTNISSYAIGDIIYASGATTLSKLPIGTASQQLRVNAGATALEYFTPAASGITVGTTTITSGANTRVAFDDGGVYGEDADFTWDKTNNLLNTTSGYSVGGNKMLYINGSFSTCVGTEHTSIGTGGFITVLGNRIGELGAIGGGSTAIGRAAARGGCGIEVISIGASANYGGTSATYSLFIGSSSLSSAGMNNTASNQAVIGMPAGNGYTQFYFGQGVSAVTGTPSGVTFNATPGTTAGGLFTIAGGAASGSDIPGGNLVLRAGVSNGNNASTTQGDVDIQSCITPLASGTTAQTPVSVFKIKKSGAIEISTKVINVTSGDAATINSTVGRFRKDNSGATFTLTNSLIVANSVILLTPANAAIDASATTWTVSAGVGSATITFNAAPAADFDMNFFVLN